MPDQGARTEPDPDTRSASADVAVVIVNFNSGGDVSRAVRSVLDAAGDARVEIVVVDNHSRDGSADRAEADFPGLRVVRNERNVGFPSAANVGMLFVPSIGGRSHCPDEATTADDVVLGTRALATALRELAYQM